MSLLETTVVVERIDFEKDVFAGLPSLASNCVSCYDISGQVIEPDLTEEPAMSGATVQDLNRQLARRINQEARSNPQSPYANKFIGIANGQVVVVADDLDEMAHRLRQ